MLEGHVVAHATHTAFGAKVNGELDPAIETFFDGEPRWMKWEGSRSQFAVLSQTVDIPNLAVGGPVRLDEDNIGMIRNAVDNGTSTDGLPLTFRLLDPDDRLRFWLPDRFKGEQLWITPWNLPGIEQPAGTLTAIRGRDAANEATIDES